MTYLNGEVYSGEWKYNEANGQGTLRYPNGDILVGSFVQNKPHGRGSLTHPDGVISEGTWHMGVKHGEYAAATFRSQTSALRSLILFPSSFLCCSFVRGSFVHKLQGKGATHQLFVYGAPSKEDQLLDVNIPAHLRTAAAAIKQHAALPTAAAANDIPPPPPPDIPPPPPDIPPPPPL